MESPGTLYLVATPIGNLEDITYRAIRILKEVDLIACEDTRHTRKLLSHYGIKKPTISYHQHNEKLRSDELLHRLVAGKQIALVSDAGTPAISDPGFRIVKAAIDSSIPVVPVPGPSAAIAALIVSGFPIDDFFFGGFLPARKNQRRTRLAELATVQSTLVLYEAPHRIVESLIDASELLGDRNAVVARELTKLHEEILRGRLSEIATKLSGKAARGEMVLIIDRSDARSHELADAPRERMVEMLNELQAEGMEQRTALKQVARRLGISRDEAYRRLTAERARQKEK